MTRRATPTKPNYRQPGVKSRAFFHLYLQSEKRDAIEKRQLSPLGAAIPTVLPALRTLGVGRLYWGVADLVTQAHTSLWQALELACAPRSGAARVGESWRNALALMRDQR